MSQIGPRPFSLYQNVLLRLEWQYCLQLRMKFQGKKRGDVRFYEIVCACATYARVVASLTSSASNNCRSVQEVTSCMLALFQTSLLHRSHCERLAVSSASIRCRHHCANLHQRSRRLRARTLQRASQAENNEFGRSKRSPRPTMCL